MYQKIRTERERIGLSLQASENSSRNLRRYCIPFGNGKRKQGLRDEDINMEGKSGRIYSEKRKKNSQIGYSRVKGRGSQLQRTSNISVRVAGVPLTVSHLKKST